MVMKFNTCSILFLVFFVCLTTRLNAQPKPNPMLQRSKAALGLTTLKKPVLHFYYNQVRLAREQSDRVYPPYFTTSTNVEGWLNTEINTTFIKSNTIRVGSGPSDITSDYYSGISKYYSVRDTNYMPRSAFVEYDKMNAWTVLLDWAADPTVTQVKSGVYRDYDRLIFERPALIGMERLFIDPKTYFPVKLDYEELNSLWGQLHIEIVYNNWLLNEGSYFPGSSFRIEDSQPTIYRSFGRTELNNSVSLFDRVKKLPTTSQKNFNNEWYVSEQPKLIKISEQTYISKNNFYSETFTKIGDTLYLMDATLNEERAKQDEKLIKGVFPDVSKFVVIVTDLAWPHIGGVRYWVSKGATIVSHAISREFLQKVINRKWTVQPDELQKHPRAMRFVAVNKITNLANGALKVIPIDGIESEGALICYLTGDKYLWGSDYFQNSQAAAANSQEVINAARRENIQPEKIAAEHVGLTDWSQLLKINKQ